MKNTIEVTQKDTLLHYLENMETGHSKSKLKSLLKYECIMINGVPTTQFNAEVNEGDIIHISSYNTLKDTKLDIIYENEHILVIDKPAGLLTVATSKNEPHTAYREASSYVKKINRNNKIFVIHRLDQDTSGVLMFAKTKAAQEAYQEDWNERVKERAYIAIVEGVVEKEEDTITSFLRENKTTHMYSTTSGQKAITHYDVIKRSNFFTLLKVDIYTGRKNQIRVHMNDIGHPIVGDKKYDATQNPMKRLGLHAYRLRLIDPYTKKEEVFTAPIPVKFKKLIKLSTAQEQSI